MNNFSPHNDVLRAVFSKAKKLKSGSAPYDNSLDSLDGVLRALLSIDEMREAGTFFTGDELASETVACFRSQLGTSSIVLDPACGAGNLLIACSRKLSIRKTLSSTLKDWGQSLRGTDLYPEFIEATKIRIVLEAIHRGCEVDCELDRGIKLLPNIKCQDAMLIEEEDVRGVTHVIMNPPFTLWDPPSRQFSKEGKINAAALVFQHLLSIAPIGVTISAILPEVLRSGSRYEQWRRFVESRVVGSIKIFGRFNKQTDVDVFTINIEKGCCGRKVDWQTSPSDDYIPISNVFDVSVGPVVPHRHPEIGELRPFIHPRNVPVWQTVSKFGEQRRFSGRVVPPPFLVIRRTSRPGDKYRAAASIIGGTEAVAVENHLIVVRPKNSSLAECECLLQVLQSERTNTFLNRRIRCRHLTVDAVKNVPYKKLEK